MFKLLFILLTLISQVNCMLNRLYFTVQDDFFVEAFVLIVRKQPFIITSAAKSNFLVCLFVMLLSHR